MSKDEMRWFELEWVRVN